MGWIHVTGFCHNAGGVQRGGSEPEPARLPDQLPTHHTQMLPIPLRQPHTNKSIGSSLDAFIAEIVSIFVTLNFLSALRGALTHFWRFLSTKFIARKLVTLLYILCYVTIIYSRKHQSNYIKMPAFIYIIYKIKTFPVIEGTCRYYVRTQNNDDCQNFPKSFSDTYMPDLH